MAQHNRLPERIEGFANRVRAAINKLDFDQRQKILRLVVEEVRVKGWQVEIKLRIPLDSALDPPGGKLSMKDRLCSLHKIKGESYRLKEKRKAGLLDTAGTDKPRTDETTAEA